MTHNGETQNTDRRRENGKCSDESYRLGESRCNCQGNELDAVGLAESDRTGENSIRASIVYGDTTAGKMLQRLELVEKSHKDYVRAHQARLKARLNESEELERLFEQSVEELRQEIYQLATEENETNGSGHQ